MASRSNEHLPLAKGEASFEEKRDSKTIAIVRFKFFNRSVASLVLETPKSQNSSPETHRIQRSFNAR